MSDTLINSSTVQSVPLKDGVDLTVTTTVTIRGGLAVSAESTTVAITFWGVPHELGSPEDARTLMQHALNALEVTK